MRKGFSLVTAIFMMVLISVLGVAILSLAAMSSVQKSQSFLRAQAELLADSAIEYTILRIADTATPTSDAYTQVETHEGWTRISEQKVIADPFVITVKVKYIDGVDELNGTAFFDATAETTIDNMPVRFHKKKHQLP
ncbi:hypothetical protein FACS1894103_0320 [Campylobacterota bacterium]|nr:hypothetical protein FACS1894103_0320 [Campylobacterota bacterium]